MNQKPSVIQILNFVPQVLTLDNLQLIDDELATGKLIKPFDVAVKPDEAYYLIMQENRVISEEASAVREWLMQQIK